MDEKRLFGTDGIRAEAGAFPLDPETLKRTGFALATVLATAGGKARVLVGRDTRVSGPDIERALTLGLLAGDVQVTSGGILSTPAVAYLTRSGAFDAGIVISASHNAFSDNGIKIFSRDGFKLADSVERQVEALVLDETDDVPIPERDTAIYENRADPLLKTRYLGFLTAALPRGFSFEGRHVVLDCANGAASTLAPEAFRRLGAEVSTFSCAPDGRNINDGCGALHPERLAEEVKKRGAFFGAAYDGDANRCILVDETGTVRDGDDILAAAATAMQAEGRLGAGGVVSTVMANLGLELYIRSLGAGFTRTAVGDKYVLSEMLAQSSHLGGEQSGHIIFLDDTTTGDGILTSLRLAHLVVSSGRPLSALASCWTRLPQVLRNVRVRERVDLRTVPAIAERLSDLEKRMDGRGRVLVRYSGTEPLLRIMLEGEDQAEIERHAGELAESVRSALG